MTKNDYSPKVGDARYMKLDENTVIRVLLMKTLKGGYEVLQRTKEEDIFHRIEDRKLFLTPEEAFNAE